MVGRQSGFGVDNEAAGFWVLPRSGCRYNTVNWIRQGEEENILEVGPRSRKVRYYKISTAKYPTTAAPPCSRSRCNLPCPEREFTHRCPFSRACRPLQRLSGPATARGCWPRIGSQDRGLTAGRSTASTRAPRSPPRESQSVLLPPPPRKRRCIGRGRRR